MRLALVTIAFALSCAAADAALIRTAAAAGPSNIHLARGRLQRSMDLIPPPDARRDRFSCMEG